MTVEQIHNALKDDIAYQYAVEDFDLINMGIVLRAHGFPHSVEDICRVFEYLGVTPENSK